jgi:YggT family protein
MKGQDPTSMILSTLGGLIVMSFLLRTLLPICKANYFNPLSQYIIKFTDYVCKPIRMVIKPLGPFDPASLIAAYLIQLIVVTFIVLFTGYKLQPGDFPILMLAALYSVAQLLIYIYMGSLIVVAIASWVAPRSNNPGLALMGEILDPLSRRIRNILPPMGGLDFSLMILLYRLFDHD